MAETKAWADYFKESMQSVGLETPKGYFDSAKTAGKTVAALIALFARLPASATMTELAIAGQAVEPGPPLHPERPSGSSP